MKKTAFGIALLALLMMSNMVYGQIKSKSTGMAIEKVEFKDSCKYGYVEISLELPKGNTTVLQNIRASLWQKLVERMGTDCNYGSLENAIPAYKGERKFQSLCNYYGEAAFKKWNEYMKAENDDREEYIRNSTDMSDEEKESALEYTDQYGFSIDLKKEYECKRYVVFNGMSYGYTGGAHGGVYGMGCVTYDLYTGKELKNIIKPGMERALQSLLKRGLKQYFAEGNDGKMTTDSELFDELEVENRRIPLPAEYNVWPSKNGIEFVYGQYEIACYAAGMPSFTIPFSQIKPFLTNEAIKILGLSTASKR